MGAVSTDQVSGSDTYILSAWLFLRLLGFIYLAAFVSLAGQIKGLVGRNGILPAADFLGNPPHWSFRRFRRLPTLCWWSTSDGFLSFLCWGGAVLAVLLIVGVAPVIVLIVLWAFYLSLFNICRSFLGYQWDILLLEMGFLAIFLAPLEFFLPFPPAVAPSPIIRWLLWWLLFRLMFSSGAVKIRSGEPTWRDLSALCFHYETQPLPTPVAWHAHQLPARFHRVSAIVMFAIELFAPFLIFGPPLATHAAAGLFILLMILIQLTGNYCFFNFQAIALSVLLLDDQFIVRLFPGIHVPFAALAAPAWPMWFTVVVAMIIGVLSLEPIFRLLHIQTQRPRWLMNFFEWFAPFCLVNSYGLFSVMTTERPEIIVEGSADGVHWQAYEFKWKPGDPRRAPRFVAPHQPRLDWQMWFAALGFYPNHAWFHHFLERLRAGSPAVLSLLKKNPFPDAPPQFVRAVVYDYRFTDRATRRETGEWWRRERRGAYSPILGVNSKHEV